MKNIFLIIGISLFFNGSLYAQSEILSHAMLFIVTFLPKNFENGKRDFAMRWKK